MQYQRSNTRTLADFYAQHFLTYSFQGRKCYCNLSLAIATFSGIVISNVMVLEHYGTLPLQRAFVTCLLSDNTWTREWKTSDQNIIWCVKFCGKVGRPAPIPMLSAICFVFDFKACLKSSYRKRYLPRNSSIWNKEKTLGIPHSLLHSLSVKPVRTEQQSERFLFGIDGVQSTQDQKPFLMSNLKFGSVVN